MSIAYSSALSKAPDIAKERERIGAILRRVYGNGRTPGFRLGFLDGRWKFKCVTKRLNISKEEYSDNCITLFNSDIEIIKQTLEAGKDKLIEEAKNNKEEKTND